MRARESDGLWRKIRELEHTGETWRESIISSCCSTSPSLSNRMRTDRSGTKHVKIEDLGKMCDAWLKRCVNEWLYVTRFSIDLVTVVTSPIPGSTKPTSLCSFITRGKLEEESAPFVLMLRFAIFYAQSSTCFLAIPLAANLRYSLVPSSTYENTFPT